MIFTLKRKTNSANKLLYRTSIMELNEEINLAPNNNSNNIEELNNYNIMVVSIIVNDINQIDRDKKNCD